MTRLHSAATSILLLSLGSMSLAAQGNRGTLDKYLASIPHLAPVATVKRFDAGKPPAVTVVNGQSHSVTTGTTHEEVPFGRFAALNPNTANLYPGALVAGRSMASGRLTEIVLPRTAGTITLQDLTKTGAGRVLYSRRTLHPSLASSRYVQHLLVENPKTIAPNTPANIEFQSSESESDDKALLDLGLSASYMSVSIAASLRSARHSHAHGVYVSFIQKYYSLAFAPPSSPSSFIAATTPLSAVKIRVYAASKARPVNPLLYVSSVSYGRMLLLAVSSNEEQSSLTSALNAAYNSIAACGKLSLTTEQEKTLSNSQMRMVALGGPASAAVSVTVPTLKRYLEQGANYHPLRSPGVPISYVLNYVDDNSIAETSFSANYADAQVSDTPIPVDGVSITFKTGGDDKDDEMGAIVSLTGAGGGEIASGDGGGPGWGSGSVWSAHSDSPEFRLAMSKDGLLLSQCEGAVIHVHQKSSRGTNPGWQFSFEVAYYVGGKKLIAKASKNDEFYIGDTHDASADAPLGCPSYP